MARVRIGTCTGPAELALLRAALQAHGVRFAIHAEHHASLLGGLGGAFAPLHVDVHPDDAEEAAALLADLRRPRCPEDDLDSDELALDADDRAEAAAAQEAEARRRALRMPAPWVVIALACCVTFGAAHWATRAWLRGLALAGAEALGLAHVLRGDVHLGAGLVLGAIAVDLAGALGRLRGARAAPPIPPARVVEDAPARRAPGRARRA
jgi:hypothetical protein